MVTLIVQPSDWNEDWNGKGGDRGRNQRNGGRRHCGYAAKAANGNAGDGQTGEDKSTIHDKKLLSLLSVITLLLPPQPMSCAVIAANKNSASDFCEPDSIQKFLRKPKETNCSHLQKAAENISCTIETKNFTHKS